MKILRALALLIALALPCTGQQVSSPHFEVASVRRAEGHGFGRSSGGPGRSDPDHVYFERVTLEYLIRIAYNLGLNQISGPDWLNTEYYAVRATLPHGSTMEDFRLMIGALLRERFGLMTHRVSRQMRGYEITIGAGGPKLDRSVPDPLDSSSEVIPLPPQPGAGKFPVLGPGSTWMSNVDDGMMRMTFRESTMGLLADRLRFVFSGSGHMGSAAKPVPVRDKTGLQGKFSFHLAFPVSTLESSPGSSGNSQEPDVISAAAVARALRNQLGLRLTRVPIPLDFIVVDHILKTPTEN